MTGEERDEYIRYINDQYTLLINKISYGIVKDENLAEDIKQQVLIRLASKAELLKPLHPRQLATYIAITTKTVSIDEYRKQRSYEKKKSRLIEYYQNNMTMDRIEFKAFEGKYGFSEDVWKLLMQLTPLERDIMVYTYYYELTAEEVSTIIGTNKEMVKKRLQRIRRKLADIIEKEGVDFR